jgi:DNA-binding CsgD family transcriptional regulator
MRVRVESLRDRFGFTRAEATFALEIMKGDGRQAAANRLGISLGTARSHLSSIFDKTGSRHQAELVLLCGSDGQGCCVSEATVWRLQNNESTKNRRCSCRPSHTTIANVRPLRVANALQFPSPQHGVVATRVHGDWVCSVAALRRR